MNTWHDALELVYGPKSSGATPLLSADRSTFLTDKDSIFGKWVEHINSLLSRPSTVNNNAINRLRQIECNVLLDERHELLIVTQTRKTIQHLSSGKTPGADILVVIITF